MKSKRHSKETKQKISLSLSGRILTDEHKRKISLSKIGKHLGLDNPFYGKKHSKEARLKMSKNRTNAHDEQHPKWKGVDVGYSALHSWIKKRLGQPNKCESCNTETAKKYEWANISGEYKRNLTDWIRLCTSCHHKYDNIQNKGWITRKKLCV